jgi:hypothetical protein
MKTVIFTLVLIAQSISPFGLLPQDPPQSPPSGEHRLPPDQYCQNHAPRPNQTNARECHCDYVCEVDEEGKETGDYHAGYACLNYCEAAMKQCTCHPEEPCPRIKSGDGNTWPGHVHQGYVDLYGDPFKKD